MRGTTAIVMVAVGALAPTAAAQDTPPTSWAAVFGSAQPDLWRLGHPRVGARAALPIRGRLDFYPGLEIDPAVGAISQVFLNVRVFPLGRRGPGAFWYVGGGVALRNQGWRSNFFAALQWPTGQFRPFAELHVYNGVDGIADGVVDVQAGVALRIS